MSEDYDDLEALGVKPGAVLTSTKTKDTIVKLLGEGGVGAMTTKDYCLSLKGKQKTCYGNSSDGQYSNLNLNQFSQHSNIFSINQTTASNVSSRKEDYSIFGERNICRGNNILWKKSNFGTTDCLNVRQDFNGKKDQQKDLIKRSGNLELHIASYESYLKSIGANDSCQNDINPNSADSRKEKSGSIKKWKNVKESFTTSSSIQNPFEIPRQQSECNVDSDMPEIAKFKASQKLFENYAYDPNNSDVKPNTVIRGRKDNYKVLLLIERFTQSVFKAEEVKSKKNVVIKFFHESNGLNCVKEKDVYEKLAVIQSPHFLNLIDYGKRGSSYFLVLSVLDSSVEDKFPLIRKENLDTTRDATQLSNFTKVILAKQMLQSLEHLHSVGVIHADLSWNSFGIVDKNRIILKNFQHVRKLDDEVSKSETPAAVSTLKYAPRALHTGKKLAFKDDIESVLYLIAEMFTSLPWTNGHYSSEDLGIFKSEELSTDSTFMKRLPYSLRFLILSVVKLKRGNLPPYQKYQTNLSNLFTASHMRPIIDWNLGFVYYSNNIPPHDSIPFYYSADGKTYMLILKCEQLFPDKNDSTLFFYEGGCGCSIKVEDVKFGQFKIANIFKKYLKCKKHVQEKYYRHVCMDNELHPMFPSKLNPKKDDEKKAPIEYFVNASDYSKEVLDKMAEMPCSTARSSFCESDFADCDTAHLFTNYD